MSVDGHIPPDIVVSAAKDGGIDGLAAGTEFSEKDIVIDDEVRGRGGSHQPGDIGNTVGKIERLRRPGYIRVT